MSKKTSLFQRLAAAILIIIGAIAMLAAWFILLTTATHNMTIIALEIGGVVVCLAGYFLWKRSKLLKKELANP
jgi:O-antigen/teichoic acid export membrane protein